MSFLDSHVHKSDTGLLDFQVQTDKILPVPTRKGEATKARILEAAADLLISGNDINLDEVMDLTHTSKGQIFHYFPGGKEELRRTAAERHLARLAQADAPAALATWQDWESWIEQILRLHKKQGRTDACEVAALAGRALDTDRSHSRPGRPDVRTMGDGARDSTHRHAGQRPLARRRAR
jgi:AcrR family transcriptional regulator